MFKSKCLSAIAAAVAMLSTQAHSSGAVAGATEFTQILNNSELAVGVTQQMKTVQQLVLTYKTTLDQYKEMLNAGKLLNVDNLLGPLKSIPGEIAAVNDYLKSLKKAGISFEDMKKAIDTRNVEAKLKKLTFEEYIAQEGEKIKQGDKRARQRIEDEEKLIKQVNEDFTIATTLSNEISKTSGVHASMGLLNTHMNRVIQQNARMTQIMAAAGTRDAIQIKKETDAAENSLKTLKDMSEKHEKNYQNDLELIKNMRK